MNLTTLIFIKNNQKDILDIKKNLEKIENNKIIFIDINSKDETVDLLKKYNLNFFQLNNSLYVEPIRQKALDKVKEGWVLIIDADERLSDELADEIQEAIKTSNYSYFKIPRKNIFINKWLRYGGWYPDYQIRLINKKYFVKWPKEIHSTPIIQGNGGFLKNPLIHYFHGNLESMVKKTIIFEDIESELLFRANKDTTIFTFFRKFFGELWRRLFKQLGLLDGKIGIIESIYQAFSKTITYLFLYEKRYKSRSLQSLS